MGTRLLNDAWMVPASSLQRRLPATFVGLQSKVWFTNHYHWLTSLRRKLVAQTRLTVGSDGLTIGLKKLLKSFDMPIRDSHTRDSSKGTRTMATAAFKMRFKTWIPSTPFKSWKRLPTEEMNTNVSPVCLCYFSEMSMRWPETNLLMQTSSAAITAAKENKAGIQFPWPWT